MIPDDVVLDTLAAIVEEKGEGYRYTREHCVYAEGGYDSCEPSCIVGHVLFRLAPDTFRLVAESYNDDISCGQLAREGLLEEFSPRSVKVLEAAQDKQDGMIPWGQVLAHARWEMGDEG